MLFTDASYSDELNAYLSDTNPVLPEIEPAVVKSWLNELGLIHIFCMSIFLEFSFSGRLRHLMVSHLPKNLRLFGRLNSWLADYLAPLIIIGIFSVGLSADYISYLVIPDNAGIDSLHAAIFSSVYLLFISRTPFLGGYVATGVGFFLFDILLLKIYIPYFMPQLKVISLSMTMQSVLLFIGLTIFAYLSYRIIQQVNISKWHGQVQGKDCQPVAATT